MSADAIYRLAIGDIVAMTLVNLDDIHNKLVARNLVVEKAPNLEWKVSLSAENWIQLLGGLWFRLVYSLMSVESFVELIDRATRADRSGFA
jgi:hypothetical protein